MTDTFLTTAEKTTSAIAQRSNRLTRAVTAKRTDRLIRNLRQQLDLVRASDPSNPNPHRYHYGLVQAETDRIFREIDDQGRLHVVDVVSGDETSGPLAFVIDASSTAFVYPGDFPGQLRDDGEIFSGRFKDVGSQIRYFDGTQNQADPDLVAQTSLNSQFIGRGISYIWSRFAFQDGRFQGDPSMRVVLRGRTVVDPRLVILSPSLPFEDQTKTFSINPYRMIFDYLARPVLQGGAGTSFNLIDTDSFINSTNWSEQLVDTQQVTKTAILSVDTNKTLGTAPISTNHLFEFDQAVIPFQYGDVVEITPGPGQTVPPNLTAGTPYHVIPVRHASGDFQIPALALADTLEDALAGNSIAQGVRVSDINITKVQEIRFMTGFSYDAGEQILDRMLESCGARLYLKDGRVAITQQSFPDAADIESVAIEELLRSISLNTRDDPSERSNALSGSFTSILNLFIPGTYPIVDGGGTFRDQDGGEVLLQSFNLPFVAKPSVAQRLATVELRKRRQELTLAFSGDLSLYRLKPDTVFSLDFPKYGLDENTTFQVRDQTLFIDVSSDRPFFGVNIEARQLEAETFDLDLSNEQFVDSVQIPGLGSVFDVSPPGLPTIIESLFETRPGAGVRVRADISWAPSSSTFVRSYVVSYKRSNNVDFIFLASTPDTTVRVDDLEPGLYDFRVEAVNSAGLSSDPDDARVDELEIFGLSARPIAPTEFAGEVVSSAGVFLTWDRSTELDVLEGGFVEIRHDPAISGALARDSVLIKRDVGAQAGLPVPFKQGTYFLRFEDSSGQFSDVATWSTQSRRPVGVAQIPNGSGILEDAAGFTLQEDNTFPSTNLNNTLIFVTDHLELPLEDTFDDETDVDAITNIDDVGGGEVVGEGLYFFSTAVELSEPTRVLVEAVIAAEVFDLSNSLDDEPNFDDISNVDLVADALLQAGAADAEIQVRFSDGTVASDTFGPWEKVNTGFFENRSYEFRVRARSFSPTINIRTTQARIRMRAVPLG